jgi:hypothetical protein
LFPPPYIAWRPGVGDPDVVGWATTAAYFAVAGAFVWAARREHRQASLDRYRVRVCTVFAFLLVVLGLNKQLDCQTLIIQVGRHLALAHDWYAYRRLVEKAVAVGIALVGLFALARLRLSLKRGWHGLPARSGRQPAAQGRCVGLGSWRFRVLSLTGASLLLAFVVVRAWPMPGGGGRPGRDRIGFHWYDVLELGGVGCLGLAGMRGRNQE